MTFSNLGLADALLRAVADQGYSIPTPIQAKAIPAVLTGSDILAAAQTGTGKTAGFVLPILQRLGAEARPKAGHGRRAVRVLILVPTRELAVQVETSVKDYGRHLPFSSTIVIGGENINRQSAILRRGVDIVVATPGRLLDHQQQGNVDLSRVEMFVLDEADRMLDMGFVRDIRRVMALLPKVRQNLLFSATFSKEIRDLAHSLLDRPLTIEVGAANATVDVIDQVVHPVDQARKPELLSMLIGRNDWRQVLVFTRTKHGADKLTRNLNADGIDALAIHGNKSQNNRNRALSQFKDGDIRVLVATDIAARGIDIAELPHVVNFDLPNVPEDYVHRIGRTGRAGASGQAISLVSGEEREYLRDIERLIRKTIRSEVLDGFEPDPRAPSKSPAGRGHPSTGRGHAPAGARGHAPSGARGHASAGARGHAPAGAPRARHRDGEIKPTSQRADPRRGRPHDARSGTPGRGNPRGPFSRNTTKGT